MPGESFLIPVARWYPPASLTLLWYTGCTPTPVWVALNLKFWSLSSSFTRPWYSAGPFGTAQGSLVQRPSLSFLWSGIRRHASLTHMCIVKQRIFFFVVALVPDGEKDLDNCLLLSFMLTDRRYGG